MKINELLKALFINICILFQRFIYLFIWIGKAFVKIVKTLVNPLSSLLKEIKKLHVKIRLWITLFYSKNIKTIQKVFIILLSIFIFFLLTYLVMKYDGSIRNILIDRCISSNNSIDDFIPTFFYTIGAAILGVLAISFSFTMFAVQQAADKYSVSILRSSVRDKVNVFIYLIIASISLAFFIFALITTVDNFIYFVYSSIGMVAGVLFLLQFQFGYTATRINPIYQINQYLLRSIKNLRKISRRVNFNMKSSIILNDSNQVIPSFDDLFSQMKLGVFYNYPELFRPVKDDIEKIYTTVITYINRNDYLVTSNGLNAINKILFKYIDFKNGAFLLPSSITLFNLSHDDFLQNVLEKYEDIHKLASQKKDLEVSRQVIKTLENLALKCLDINYGNNILKEYFHCILVSRYMKNCIESSLRVELNDIGIQGSGSLRVVGEKLVDKGANIDIHSIIDYILSIAAFGLLKPNTSYLIASPLKDTALLLRLIMLSNKLNHKMIIKMVLDKIKNIIDLYVKFKEPNGISNDMEYSIGSFIALTNTTAIPYIFTDIIKQLENKSLPEEERRRLVSVMVDFAHELWHFYDDLSKIAAEKESFLFFYISQNIHYIARILINLYESSILDKDERDNIIKETRWIISNYWRIYNYHKLISKNYELEILRNLMDLGVEFRKLNLKKESIQILDIIFNIAKSFLLKQRDSFGFDPIRILKAGCYLCILYGDKAVWKMYIGKIKSDFWTEYLKEFSDNRGVLINELSELDPEDSRLNKHHESIEDSIISQLDINLIKEFIELIKQELYEVT